MVEQGRGRASSPGCTTVAQGHCAVRIAYRDADGRDSRIDVGGSRPILKNGDRVSVKRRTANDSRQQSRARCHVKASMNVPDQRRYFGTVPSLRQIFLGTSLFSATKIHWRAPAIFSSFSDIDDEITRNP